MPQGNKGSAAIVGVGYTGIDRRSRRSITSYALEAAIKAIDDAGLSRDQIDGYLGSPSAPNPSAVHADGADEVSAYLMVNRLGLRNLGWAADVSGMPLAMVVSGMQAIAAGDCRAVLGVRAVYNLPGRRYAASTAEQAFGEDQFWLPFGYGPGGTRFATELRRYFARSGATREDLFHVVEAARVHAGRNPLAYWSGQQLDLDTYLSGRMIADPLSLYDCDLPVCGAGAFVLTSAERAVSGPHRPAYVAGYANWTHSESIFDRVGITPRDIQVAQVYDGYASFVYPWLEELGFCDRGDAWRFVNDRQTWLGGALPTNTFGGSLGEGRMHGIGHLNEAVLQVAGRAGARQVADVENCLVQVGPPDKSWLLVLSSHP